MKVARVPRAMALFTILALFNQAAGAHAQIDSSGGQVLRISLEEAFRRGIAVSPAVAAATGAVRAPRGRKAEAWWPFPDNPILEYGRIRRRTPLATVHDRQWAVTQEVEIAGQWVARGRAASASVRSAEARVEDARRRAGLEIRAAYAVAALAERRAALTDSAAAFAARLAEFARRQFDAGELNRLELNAATLEAARARSGSERARAESEAGAAELARLLALPRDSTPRTTVLPPIPALTWDSDSLLQVIARARRPDLAASEAARQSTERMVTAARLAFVPNLTIGAAGGRESGTDDLLGLSLGLRLPLFHRQQGAIGAAEGERIAAQAEVAATERAILAEVVSAGARFTRARLVERSFATEVLQAATQNVVLTERALTEGEVSLTDVLVLRRTAVEAQLEYLDVLNDAYTAWFSLAAALAAEPGELAALLGGTR
ncbi:MAG: TolC family protein [Gemmatimonadales bacterium]